MDDDRESILWWNEKEVASTNHIIDQIEIPEEKEQVIEYLAEKNSQHLITDFFDELPPLRHVVQDQRQRQITQYFNNTK